MTERDRERMSEWLAAELAGDDDRADRLFARLASSSLPAFEAPDGLTDRIIAALPVSRWSWRAIPDITAARWARVTAAAAVIVLGVSLALLSLDRVFGLAVHATAAGASAVHGLVVAVQAILGAMWAGLGLMNALGVAAGAVALTGVVPLLLAANLMLSMAAFAGLKRLLAPGEEYR